MSRYYKDPEATAQALAGGWLHTGDVARMDSDGFFYIDGRMKDVIISGGENVYPVPIEDFLRTHPGVKDAAVFGICDCRLGEVIAAQVSLTQADACTAEELLTFCQQLPKFERPRKIFIGDVSPVILLGKLTKWLCANCIPLSIPSKDTLTYNKPLYEQNKGEHLCLLEF